MERLEISAEECMSKSQKRIFDDIDFSSGLTVCEAAAGAGKTRTLSFLVLKALMTENVENVCVLTSTKVAKEEALARVNKLHENLGYMRDGACPVLRNRNVRTIHSVCLEVAKDEDAENGGAGGHSCATRWKMYLKT